MTLKNKLSFGLASFFLILAINQARVTPVEAECTVNYGGEVCGTHTPVATDLDTESLYTISAILYSTGLASFVMAKNAGKMVPFLG